MIDAVAAGGAEMRPVDRARVRAALPLLQFARGERERLTPHRDRHRHGPGGDFAALGTMAQPGAEGLFENLEAHRAALARPGYEGGVGHGGGSDLWAQVSIERIGERGLGVRKDEIHLRSKDRIRHPKTCLCREGLS